MSNVDIARALQSFVRLRVQQPQLMVIILARFTLIRVVQQSPESEKHCRAFVLALRRQLNDTLIEFYKLLADHQAQPNSFTIHASCALQFAKHLEQLGSILLSETFASVHDLEEQHLLLVIISAVNLDLAILCEFECVFHQVYQNLFQSSCVAK